MNKPIKKIKVDELDDEKSDIIRNIHHYILRPKRIYTGLDMCKYESYFDHNIFYENDSKKTIIVKKSTFQFNIPTFSSFNRLKVLDFLRSLLAPKFLDKFIKASISLEGGAKNTNNIVRTDMLFFRVYIYKAFKEQITKDFRFVDFNYEPGNEEEDIPDSFYYAPDCYIKQKPHSLILEKDFYLNQVATSSNFISIDKNIKLKPNECIASEIILCVNAEIAAKIANPNFETICFSKFEIEEP